MRCPGCQAGFPDVEGPTHAYMLSSPGCWAAFGELMAREFSNPALMRVHGYTVDAYAAQHPGVDVPSARRSVCVHLSRLHLVLDKGWAIERANDAMLAISRNRSRSREQCRWLEPPPMTGTLTVLDALGTGSHGEHEERVTAWAESVWKAWSVHHDTVRQWCSGL